MASPKCVSLGFLVLICLTLSSAHRVLLDDKMPKHSTLAGGGGGDGGGGGSGSGSGSGSGYGSGSGSGSGGSNSGGGSGGGGGCGGSGDSGWPPSGGYYPPPTGPYYPPPTPGFGPRPGFGCPNNPEFGFGPGFGCVCGIVPGGVPGGAPGDGVLHGWGSGSQNGHVSYWAEKRDQGAAHEAHSGHGPFQFNVENGEPVPPDDSAPIMADEEMEGDHHKINNMNHKMAEPSHH